MKEYKINILQTFDVPAGANKLTVTHEWGDVLVAPVSVSGTYDFTADSIGVHKFSWLNGTNLIKNDFYSFIVPLITSSEFFNDNEDLEEFDDNFAKIERQIRHTIQNFTGQKFGPYVNKTMEIQGDGGDSLYLPVPIVSLTSVINTFGDDITEFVEPCPNDHTFIQRKSQFRASIFYEVKRDVFWNPIELFTQRFNFNITGDWGHEYIPTEVSEAAEILLVHGVGGDDIQEMKREGIYRGELGDFKFFLNADQWGTTGDTVADNLLAAHVVSGIGLV